MANSSRVASASRPRFCNAPREVASCCGSFSIALPAQRPKSVFHCINAADWSTSSAAKSARTPSRVIAALLPKSTSRFCGVSGRRTGGLFMAAHCGCEAFSDK